MTILSLLYLLYKKDLVDFKNKKTFFALIVYIFVKLLYYISNIKCKIGLDYVILQSVIIYGSFILMAIFISKNKLQAFYYSLCSLFVINIFDYLIGYYKLWYWIKGDVLFIIIPLIVIVLYKSDCFNYCLKGLVFNLLTNSTWICFSVYVAVKHIVNIYYYKNLYLFIIIGCFIIWAVINRIITCHIGKQ